MIVLRIVNGARQYGKKSTWNEAVYNSAGGVSTGIASPMRSLGYDTVCRRGSQNRSMRLTQEPSTGLNRQNGLWLLSTTTEGLLERSYTGRYPVSVGICAVTAQPWSGSLCWPHLNLVWRCRAPEKIDLVALKEIGMEPIGEYGGEDRGFRAHIDRSDGILNATLWGFWSDDDRVAWKDTLAKTHGELKASGKPWHWSRNVTDYPSQSEPIQDVHRECMEEANPNGLTKTVFVMSSRVLPKRRTDRSSNEGGLDKQFFSDEAKVLEWQREAAVAA